MILGQPNLRGLRISLAALVIAGAGIGSGVYLFGESFPNWLVFSLGLAGIGLGWVGAAVHIMDMVKQYRADAEARRQWVALHGDPDRRDDPADRATAHRAVERP